MHPKLYHPLDEGGAFYMIIKQHSILNSANYFCILKISVMIWSSESGHSVKQPSLLQYCFQISLGLRNPKKNVTDESYKTSQYN